MKTIGGTAKIGLSTNTNKNNIRLVQASCTCLSLNMGPYPEMISTVHLTGRYQKIQWIYLVERILERKTKCITLVKVSEMQV